MDLTIYGVTAAVMRRNLYLVRLWRNQTSFSGREQ